MSAIEAICNELIAEATAVREYTRDIAEMLKNPGDAKTADLLDRIRIDEVEHIQKLALALTECFFEAEEKRPEEAAAKESGTHDAR